MASFDHHSSEDLENPADNASSVPPATTTRTSTSTGLNFNNCVGAGAATDSTTNTGRSRSTTACSPIRAAEFILIFIFMFLRPFILFFDRCCFLLVTRPSCFSWFGTRYNRSGQRRPAGTIYSNLFKFNPTKTFMIMEFTVNITVYGGCLLLVGLGLTLSLPSLKSSTFLGVILWKWSLLGILLDLGYPYVYFTLCGYIDLFTNKVMDEVNSASYILWGLSVSIASFIYVLLIFLFWMLYFHDQHEGLATSWPGVDKYTTRTLAMVVVGAFLWVVKSTVLLRRKAKAIYKRFKGRVLMAAFRLFFLNLILEGKEHRELLPWKYKRYDGEWVQITPRPEPKGKEENDVDAPDPMEENAADSSRASVAFRSTFIRNIQDRIKLSPDVSFRRVKGLTKSLINLAKDPLSEDEDKQIFDILHVYRRKTRNKKYLTEKEILKLVARKQDAAELLQEELKAEYPSKRINEVPFENWVVDAHKSCVALGQTLVDVFAMTRVLDLILSWCLIVAVFLLWLLVTELATLKVLVVIGSPFLAFTFVFGDTCKTFFQGFIFAFVTHPFNIGDRCVIDGVEVEVKHINIMTTTCLKVGTKVKMVSPNSDLATKLVVNLEGKLDPKDVIEVVLQSSTKTIKIQLLERKIKSFVTGPGQRDFFEPSCRVVMKEMRDGIKIITYFQHTVDGQDVSHSQFLEKKETQRSKLFMHIKQTLDELDVQVAASQ